MRKTKKPNPFATADVVVTDSADPMAQISEPGTYALMDMVRGVRETIEVAADGSRRVVETEPLDIPHFGEAGQVLTPPPFEMFAVGKAYCASRTRWPESMELRITPGGLDLVMLFGNPTDAEIEAVGGGRIAMRLLTAPHTMMFLFRCGDGPWMDAPFSVHRLPEAERVCPPDPGEGYGWMATLILVDARTGIVRSLRPLAMSRRFSCAILNAFERQKALPADDAAHVRETAWFRRKSTSALAADAIDRFEQGDTAS